ncbi:MAG: ATP-dependent 6-phosphofructokinase [Chloroflexota bacterium]|nr:ATP-dependent 6-phosphofructokinase [Chloroflexota bacterium]
MVQGFEIQSLGVCRLDSPVEREYFQDEDNGILVDPTLRGCRGSDEELIVMEAAGPRSKIFCKPKTSRAAIVTCGGLCPGLNDVIRGITMVLWYRYGARNIIGLRYGYEGLIPSCRHQPMQLTPEVVEDIHKDGGTILGTSRGPQDVAQMVDFLVNKEIDMLFTIGGDGTQRGALAIANEISKRGLKVSVVGIPKTIDNDIMYTERSFGFETAVAMSQVPITCAHMEAKGVLNGVGLVKLMGRESGFIAAHATLASSDVNLVLVPEVPFRLERILSFLEKRLSQKSHAVIVVAEGAGQELVPTEGRDASGNRVLGDIGLFLKGSITEHFKGSDIEVTVRYIDPSYTIRSAPANANDSGFCFQLAEKAVHAAMAGRTAMIVGFWNAHFVHIPIEKAVEGRKKIDILGPLWQSVLENTGQDRLLSL